MKRPRLLDLFCGAGGAGMGYSRARFEVVGVDIAPQPHYPFEFHQADALTFPLGGFDAIHASPPCQRYMTGGLVDRARRPDLIDPVRCRLRASNATWVIENVPGAPLRTDIVLCGSVFGLPLRRHRWFEFSTPVACLVPPCDHSEPAVGVYGHPHGHAGAWPSMLPGTLGSWRSAMGIEWMDAAELAEAIPPAYTEWIGARLMAHLASVARSGLVIR